MRSCHVSAATTASRRLHRVRHRLATTPSAAVAASPCGTIRGASPCGAACCWFARSVRFCCRGPRRRRRLLLRRNRLGCWVPSTVERCACRDPRRRHGGRRRHRRPPEVVLSERSEVSAVGRNRSARVRHAEHVVAPRDFDVHVRRHARLQLQPGIRHVDDGLIGHDVLHGRRLQAHLRDVPREFVGWECVDAEAHGLARSNAADVGFVEAGEHLHLRQVGRKHEQRRCRHACGHGLANVDVARDDETVDRRLDDRVREVDLILSAATPATA